MESSEFNIIPYSPDYKEIWNKFVESSKNGTFLFNRNYLEYHSHRFRDNSYLFFKKGKLYSLFPASISGCTVTSHAGLTYGGLVMSEEATAEGILKVFSLLATTLKSQNVDRLIYKAVPHIYHKLPAEEDLYALFRHNATLSVRNISCTIEMSDRIPITRLRRRSLSKAREKGIIVRETEDFQGVWDIIARNLQEKYGATPVHSAEELFKLKNLFPGNIKIYGAFINEIKVAAAVIYLTETVAHAQYIHATKLGKDYGAVDALVTYILDNIQQKYFDFGSSNEDGGRYLNESLIHMKEGFGGRGICYDTYEISL